MQVDLIKKAVHILNQGGLVAFPTETVYGLGADASQPQAVQKIFDTKQRPADHPLIVHLASQAQLFDWARVVSPEAYRLAQAFWPGPLTLILPKQEHVLASVTGGQDSIGLRIPAHPVARALLEAFGKGIAAPSANQFTHLSPTTAAAVEEELGAKVDLILDGGACQIGLESTIVDVTGEEAVILRPGMISAEMIAAVLGQVVSYRSEASQRAPGMHHLHYAPMTRTILIRKAAWPDFLRGNADFPLALVTHTAMTVENEHIHRVQMPAQVEPYAHLLYQTLRDLDHQHFACIVIETVPEDAAWDAVRDRLNKASARP